MNIDSIYCGNCVDVMDEWDDNIIDMTLTSPPYDNLRDYKGYKFDFEGIANQLFRITKQGGVVVWVINDQFINGGKSGSSFKQALYFIDMGFLLHEEIIYQKNGFSHPSSNRYHQVWEHMFIFSKGKPKTFNGIKDRKNKYAGQTSWGKNTFRQKDGTLIERQRKTISEYGLRYNIWKYNTGGCGQSSTSKIAKKHPATFPDRLAEDHVISWSNLGDLVLDPMCGSSTVGVACKKLGRCYIGIDISPEYIQLSKQRLAERRLNA